MVMLPRLVPALMIICGAVSFGVLFVTQRRCLSALVRQPLVIAVGALGLYLFVNATWASNQSAAFSKATLFALLAVSGIVLIALVPQLDKSRLLSLATGLFCGIAAGMAALFVIIVVGQPLLIFFHTWFPFLAEGGGKDLVTHDGIIRHVEPYRLNIYVSNMVIFSLPVAIFIHQRLSGSSRIPALVALAFCVVLSTLLSENDTAKVALAVQLLVVALAFFSAKAVRWGLAAVWTLVLMFAVPLGALPHKSGWHEADWMPKLSIASRFYIWRFTAEKVGEQPLTGIGVRGTRELQQAIVEQHKAKRKSPYRLRPGRHAHNGYLQIWLELGAIGAGLTLIVGLLGLRQLASVSPLFGQTGLAVFAMLATMAGTGWGLWQTWWLASLVLVWVMLCLTKSHRDCSYCEPSPAAH